MHADYRLIPQRIPSYSSTPVPSWTWKGTCGLRGCTPGEGRWKSDTSKTQVTHTQAHAMQYCLHAEPFFRKVFNLGCTETIQDRWKSHSQGVMQTETVVSTIKVENFIIILLAKSGKTDHQCLGQGKSKPLRNLPTHNLHEMQSHPTDKPKKPLQD